VFISGTTEAPAACSSTDFKGNRSAAARRRASHHSQASSTMAALKAPMTAQMPRTACTVVPP
jgi:hypothetical protein